MSDSGTQPIIADGQSYPDEASWTVLTHPDIPETIKKLFRAPKDDGTVLDPDINDLETNDNNVVKPEAVPSDGKPRRIDVRGPEIIGQLSGTQVPTVENNAPVSSPEAMGGLLGDEPTALPNIDDVPHHDWIENLFKGLAESAKSAFTLPHDVMTGDTQAESPEAIGRAAELAQLITGSGIATTKPGTLGTGGSLLSPPAAVDEYWNLMKQGLQKDASKLHQDHIEQLPDDLFQQYHDLWSKASDDNKFTQIPFNEADAKEFPQVIPKGPAPDWMTQVKTGTEYSTVEEAIMHHIYEDDKISPAEKFKLAAMNLANDFKARMAEHKAAYRRSTLGAPEDYSLPAWRGMTVYKEGGMPSSVFDYDNPEGHKMMFSSNSPMLADMYAGHLSSHPGYHVPEGVFPTGAQVMPLMINPKDYHVFEAHGKDWQDVQPTAIREAKKAGKVGVIMKNVHDEPGSTKALPPKDVFITFPEGAGTVKSRFAQKFDPSSPNMLHMIPIIGTATAAGIVGVSTQENKT